MICSGSVTAAVHLKGCYLGSQRAQDCWIQTRLGTPADHEVAYERWWEEELEIDQSVSNVKGGAFAIFNMESVSLESHHHAL